MADMGEPGSKSCTYYPEFVESTQQEILECSWETVLGADACNPVRGKANLTPKATSARAFEEHPWERRIGALSS